jgi:hypothetical protein
MADLALEKDHFLKGRMFDDTTTTKTLGLPLWLYYYKQQKGEK